MSKTVSLQLDPRTYDRALACVHCGLCLPACPTYNINGHEGDSPRGRIQLMRGLADGKIQPTASVRQHLDLCLDCRACETACPSNVVYHELIEETRAKLPPQRQNLEQRLMQWLFFHVFVYPARLKLMLLPARVLQKMGVYGLLRRSDLFSLLPPRLSKMQQMLPEHGKLWPKRLPERIESNAIGAGAGDGAREVNAPGVPSLSPSPGSPLPPSAGTPPSPSPGTPGEGRGEGLALGGGERALTLTLSRSTGRGDKNTRVLTIGFFPGCIGSVMFDDVNRKAVELLSAAGATVVTPRAQNCCGAIHHHNGAHHPAQEFARHNIDAFFPPNSSGVDFVATNIAGCGAMLREYHFLLRDDPKYAERAKFFSQRVRDISEVLKELDIARLCTHRVEQTVTYHDACHLAHAQKVTAPPRELLAAIPGLTLVALPESDLCCGAAGTYNLTQPVMSTALAARKLKMIELTGAPVCATGNVGCAIQIQSQADVESKILKVVHPVDLLHASVFGSSKK